MLVLFPQNNITPLVYTIRSDGPKQNTFKYAFQDANTATSIHPSLNIIVTPLAIRIPEDLTACYIHKEVFQLFVEYVAPHIVTPEL